MSSNPNDLRDRMNTMLDDAVGSDQITDSEADELEHIFTVGMNSLGYM